MQVLANNKPGYVLLEVLLTISIFLSLLSYMYIRETALQDSYKRNQVRMMANLLAADIRALQQRTLYRIDNKNLMLVANDEGYHLDKGIIREKTITFADYGCPDVYFEQKIVKIYFNEFYTPSATGSYILGHHGLKDFLCIISLQPVTGRVSIYETK